jgi:hypothetical protein
MNAKKFYILLITIIPLMALGRLLQIVPPEDLIAKSKLVFVGKVLSVKVSELSTPLSYPTWEGALFPWLTVKIEVSAPLKGVKKGEVVQVMILSMDKKAEPQMINPPEVLEPDKNDVFFLCLGPTPMTNVFAAITAPYDENLSVLPLHRSNRTITLSTRDDGKELLSTDKRFALVWTLVNPSGEVVPENAIKLRNIYNAEIKTKPANDMVYLEWQSCTNADGWVTDVPKGLSRTNSDIK